LTDVADFHYELPERLIAQEPLARRDASKLMVLDRRTGAIEHRAFGDLPDRLETGDLLVVNDTRVVNARLSALKATGGRIEVLLLERLSRDPSGEAEEWRALVRGFPSASPKFAFSGGLEAEVLSREAGGETARVALRAPGGVARALETTGEPPTPPYIRRSPGDARLEEDRGRYQTVYAAAPGAVAAPTAGLHFTESLLDRIRSRGTGVSALTLHVGWGTFRPVRARRVEEHTVDPEPCLILQPTADACARAKAAGARVVAVGTTVVRALESAADEKGRVLPGARLCDLFIHPGYRFRAVDAMITNFHLPRSSLLMLVCAFAGRDLVMRAYAEAIEREYRFYSYGDAMLIL
jgi:S-adenosylmethionine:tRNA ribosyltransferase-isomerase